MASAIPTKWQRFSIRHIYCTFSPLLGRGWEWIRAPVDDYDDDDECGAIGGMTGREDPGTRRKPAPLQLCSKQIPYDLTRARTKNSEVGSSTPNHLSYCTANDVIALINKALSQAVTGFLGLCT
jgi:hypothetical protein